MRCECDTSCLSPAEPHSVPDCSGYTETVLLNIIYNSRILTTPLLSDFRFINVRCVVGESSLFYELPNIIVNAKLVDLTY